MNTKFCMVLTTCPTKKQAEHLATQLVNLKLAACVQISQAVTSVYHWNDDIVSDSEMQIMIKTMSCKLEQAFKLTLSLHPFDVPQWIVVDNVSGSEPYLNWIESNLK